VKPFNEEILRRKVALFVQLHQQQERIRRQEAQLRAREREVQELEHARRFRTLMDALPHYVWIAKGDGSVHHVNRAWLEDSGLTHEENQGFGFLTGVHPDDREDLCRAWNAAVSSGHSAEIQFRSLRERDRCFRWQLLRMVPERDDADRITGWIAVATDVDELRRVA
jgi:two-component system, sensor histidine kinase